jgi:hypothetical protein
MDELRKGDYKNKLCISYIFHNFVRLPSACVADMEIGCKKIKDVWRILVVKSKQIIYLSPLGLQTIAIFLAINHRPN